MRNPALVWMIAWLVPTAALAGVDLSKPMLCAVSQAIECGYGEECSYGPPEEVNLPPFVWVDPGKKMLREHQGERTTALRNVVEQDGELLLSGHEERAFNAAISGQTGRLSASATSHDVGFVFFGTCTNP